MKFCENCKWCEPLEGPTEGFSLAHAKCHHPKINKAAAISPKADSDVYCVLERQAIFGKCGKRARYWEPK